MSAVAPPTAAPEPAPSFSPLYQQIKALLVRGLQAGEWQAGQAIPSETELAARFRVSQGTVRKAIDELATENLLVRRQGKGTFVATHAEPATQYRFLRLVPDAGGAPALQRRLLDCRRMRAPLEVARLLALKSGETAMQVRRLLLADGRAVVLDDLWLPGNLFKGLTAERLQAWRGPMYRLFEAEFAVQHDPRRGEDPRRRRRGRRCRAAGARPGRAAAVGGAAVLHLRRPAGGVAPWPVSHAGASLPQRTELTALSSRSV